MPNTLVITIDTEGGVSRGSALIYCAADERIDGRAGKSDGKYYVETYGDVFVTGRSWRDALRKLARQLGYTAVEFKVEKD